MRPRRTNDRALFVFPERYPHYYNIYDASVSPYGFRPIPSYRVHVSLLEHTIRRVFGSTFTAKFLEHDNGGSAVYLEAFSYSLIKSVASVLLHKYRLPDGPPGLLDITWRVPPKHRPRTFRKADGPAFREELLTRITI